MPAIPREYLQRIADKKGLTSFEKEVFIERLANIEPTDLAISKQLNISRDRYSSRMTGIYKKFDISTGNLPGKSKLLFFKVLDMYQGGLKGNEVDIPIINNKAGIFSLELEENQRIEDISRIDASNKSLVDLTTEIGRFKSLKSLNVSNNKLKKIPVEIKNLKKL